MDIAIFSCAQISIGAAKFVTEVFGTQEKNDLLKKMEEDVTAIKNAPLLAGMEHLKLASLCTNEENAKHEVDLAMESFVQALGMCDAERLMVEWKKIHELFSLKDLISVFLPSMFSKFYDQKQEEQISKVNRELDRLLLSYESLAVCNWLRGEPLLCVHYLDESLRLDVERCQLVIGRFKIANFFLQGSLRPIMRMFLSATVNNTRSTKKQIETICKQQNQTLDAFPNYTQLKLIDEKLRL